MYSKHFHFFGGTLKIKDRAALRTVELDGLYPMIKIGKWYFIWWRGA